MNAKRLAIKALGLLLAAAAAGGSGCGSAAPNGEPVGAATQAVRCDQPVYCPELPPDSPCYCDPCGEVVCPDP